MSGGVSNLRRVMALADYLAEPASDYTPDVWPVSHGVAISGPGHSEWLVVTDEEADAAASEYIADTLWAFNAKFLAEETELPAEVFKQLQPLCEDANAAVLAIVEKTCGLDELVSEAIRSDGRGHFLATYDGEEVELAHNLYAYRTN